MIYSCVDVDSAEDEDQLQGLHKTAACGLMQTIIKVI